ncbi:MAG: PilZ domain-containing protein [Nitrospirota bacterium]
MDSPDRRRGGRVPHLVEIRYASDSPVLTARVTDVSETGLFVDARSPLPDGARVTFSFFLGNSPWDQPVTGEGKVVWRQEGVGMGIEFIAVTDEDRMKLKLFLGRQAA